ncbi:hypothetical protein IQ260_24525 [Leptolyngbya cf. ectocarpi LEGE 11479]|uniref:Caspase family protein n=1 Tax=Leptolyngbya cf. ectocarpi LEGE 11479 TaxID=1828722 RepID=A0A928ZYP0_LEPEC|nr:hypothetical protein [Leptolyngbya ectocarpi]MBE9069813.1 hypothetical protein [Leptolyngbya cf. ectocarpi LEGE 11479]
MGSKHILLVGVSAGELATEHGEGSPAIANVTALKETFLELEELRQDQITTLINPTLKELRHAIVVMTYRCRRGDVCLIYYTGCGVMDTTGTFYLPAHDTQLEAITTTAVSSDYIRQVLPSTKDNLQRAMILDCLWGALPPQSEQSQSQRRNPVQEVGQIGDRAIEQAAPPVHQGARLADCNCTLLTAMGSATNPWPITDRGLSLYTQSLVEGMASGLADVDADGGISSRDLQTYLEQTLAMANTQLLPIATYGDDAHRPMLPVPTYSPEREYRRSVEDYAHRHRGYIPPECRDILEFLRHQLGITQGQSQAIEAKVMAPYAKHRENCDRYRHALTTALALENPLDQPLKKWLRHLQGDLALSHQDVSTIEAQILDQPHTHSRLPQWLTPVDLPQLPASSPNGH